MGKKGFLFGMAVVFIITTSGISYAQDVLKSDMKDGVQVVKARKSLMQAVNANIQDADQKLKAGNVKEIGANGINIVAIATVLPPFFKEAHEKAYPIEGSQTFFKGAPAAEFEAAADKMRAAGMEIRQAAEKGDKAGVEAGIKSVKSSCGGCHSAFRGKK
jgi:hypothetical protein